MCSTLVILLYNVYVENFLVKKGNRYTFNRSTSRGATDTTSEKAGSVVPLAGSSSKSESSKRKLSYNDSQLSTDALVDTQPNKVY